MVHLHLARFASTSSPTMSLRTCIAVALLVVPSMAIEISAITKCQTGKTDIVGDSKIFTVQVCNLFGSTCYMNHVQTASADCATKALKIENKQCALFPIMSYNNYDRSDATKLRVGGSGCSVSCSGTDCKFSGGCVSVQCGLSGSTFAGPGMTKGGTGSSRKKAVTDTAAAEAFVANTFAGISDVSGSKTVLLSRTGNYVGTYQRGGSASGTNTYTWGKLPTIDGNNYGPKACPSKSSLLSSASGITKEELRMCGATGKWVYFAAVNLLMDKAMYAKYSGDSATGLATTKINIGSVPFLHGESAYRSGAHMDDSRRVYLHDGAATADVLMETATIVPTKSENMKAQDYAGQWRFYTAVFYCSKYDRTDLTTCPADNRAIFYVADPNPTPAFGTTAGWIGAGDRGDEGSVDTTSAADRATVGAAAGLAVTALMVALSHMI